MKKFSFNSLHVSALFYNFFFFFTSYTSVPPTQSLPSTFFSDHITGIFLLPLSNYWEVGTLCVVCEAKWLPLRIVTRASSDTFYSFTFSASPYSPLRPFSTNWTRLHRRPHVYDEAFGFQVLYPTPRTVTVTQELCTYTRACNANKKWKKLVWSAYIHTHVQINLSGTYCNRRRRK